MAAILRNPRRRWSSVRGVAMAALVVVWSVSHIRTYATRGAWRRPAIGRVPALRPGTICRNGNSSGATFACLARQHCTAVVGSIAHRWELALAGMTPDDLASLRRAVQSLEHPSLAARLTNMVGKPIELIGYALPDGRVGRDHDRHLQGSRPRPQRGAGDDSTRPAPAIAALSPRLGHGIGGCGGRLRPACSPRRASRVDDHHAAVDRGDCTQRGRGPVQPRKRHSHACRSLHWAAGPARPMLPKADILPCGASLQRA